MAKTDGIPRPGPAPARLDADSVLQGLPEPVLVVDGQLAIAFANAAAEAFLALSRAMLVGRTLDALLSPDSSAVALVNRVLSTGRDVVEHGVVLQGFRLEPRLVTIRGTPLAAASGTHVAMTLSVRSIAERLDAQQSRAASSRSVGALAAMLAHEVRNPLAGIRAAAQLLELDVGAQGQELTRLIVEESDRVGQIVERMEMFAEGGPRPDAPVNIHEVLDQVLRIAAAGFARHVRFVRRYDPSLPAMLGDREQLVRALLNIVKNAAEALDEQASDEGGEILLATAFQHGLRLAAPGGARVHLPLSVSVVDNGPGIAEEMRPYLFDAFVTSKRNGTGLGLPLAAKIVTDHGGMLEVESRPGRTEFRLLLPLGSSAPGEARA